MRLSLILVVVIIISDHLTDNLCFVRLGRNSQKCDVYWLEEESVTIRKIVGKIAVVGHSKMTLLAAELLYFRWEVRPCIA